MSEKRFTSDEEGNILDDGDILTVEEVLEYLNWYRRDMLRFSVENEHLKKRLYDFEKRVDEIDKLTAFELNALKLLHCIATMKRGHTYEQNVYLNLLEQLFFPEKESDDE